MLVFFAVAVTQLKNRGGQTSLIADVNCVEERERAEKWAKTMQQKKMEGSRVKNSANNTLENTRHHTSCPKIVFFKGGAEVDAQ